MSDFKQSALSECQAAQQRLTEIQEVLQKIENACRLDLDQNNLKVLDCFVTSQLRQLHDVARYLWNVREQLLSLSEELRNPERN